MTSRFTLDAIFRLLRTHPSTRGISSLESLNEYFLMHREEVERAVAAEFSPGELSCLLEECNVEFQSLSVPPVRLSQDTRDSLRPLIVSTGVESLDRILRGGIRTGLVTEIAGESATGKTHLCLQLAIRSQLPTSLGGIDGRTLYISTEEEINSSRLAELAQICALAHPDHISSETLLDGIYIQRATTIHDLWATVTQRLRHVLDREYSSFSGHTSNFHSSDSVKCAPIRLVIVDSIAALFRSDYGDEELEKRASDMFQFGSLFKEFASRYRIGIIVVNQAADVITQMGTDSASFSTSRDRSNAAPARLSLSCQQKGKKPALGFAWSNCINTRVFLERTRNTIRTTYSSHSSRSLVSASSSLQPSSVKLDPRGSASSSFVDPCSLITDFNPNDLELDSSCISSEIVVDPPKKKRHITYFQSDNPADEERSFELRKARLLYSPFASSRTTGYYIITGEGIVDCTPSLDSD